MPWKEAEMKGTRLFVSLHQLSLSDSIIKKQLWTWKQQNSHEHPITEKLDVSQAWQDRLDRSSEIVRSIWMQNNAQTTTIFTTLNPLQFLKLDPVLITTNIGNRYRSSFDQRSKTEDMRSACFVRQSLKRLYWTLFNTRKKLVEAQQFLFLESNLYLEKKSYPRKHKNYCWCLFLYGC